MELLSLCCSSLTLLLLCFSSFLDPAIARGGEEQHTSNNFSGFTESTNGGFSTRKSLLWKNHNRVELANGYMSNLELEKAMKRIVKRFSNISRMYSIGKSVNGFPLWVLEISDKPGQEEAEPAFKFIGNVHGDEPVGRELLLLLANWLCENYMKDALATLIISNIHLHILPSMNPDGFSLRRRGNANNIDLNRDFPDQFFSMNDELEPRQPETKAIIGWSKERHFMASASLHGGALVANYPWDGSQDKSKSYTSCPDDKTFRYMATVYSHSHYNMSLSPEFQKGITNGAAWYPIYGGMQDWNYIHGGCFELTLEISDVKWPPAEELLALWDMNRMSMLNLVASLVKTGVHGKIVSSLRGEPLTASIEIKGINYTVKAGEAFGDYHRMLAPGEIYQVIATVPGYKSKATRISLEEEAGIADFILDPEDVGLDQKQIKVGCDCSNCGNNKLEFVELAGRTHVQISLVGVIVLTFFCVLLKRKMSSRLPNQRHSATPKRSSMVV